MKKRVILLAMMSMAFSLLACDGLRNEDAGVITGAVVGGILGNSIGGGDGRVIATIGGTMLGALIGGKVGRSMDASDKQALNNALENQATGKNYSWVNPDSHNRYTVRCTKTTYRQGRPCRHFKTTAMIAGKAEVITGKACRKDNGTWQMVS